MWCSSCQKNVIAETEIHISGHIKTTTKTCSKCNLILEQRLSENIPEKFPK